MNWAPVASRRRASCATSTPSRSRRRSARPGSPSIMNAYHELDGVPCGCSRALLTELLRDELGFDGVGGRRLLHGRHTARLPPHRRTTRATPRGWPSKRGSTSSCRRSTASARRSPRRSHAATYRSAWSTGPSGGMLRLKLQLGLFEQPYVDAEAAPRVFDTAPQRALARELAPQVDRPAEERRRAAAAAERSPARRRDRAFGATASACCRATTTTRRIWRSSSAPSTSMRPRRGAAPAQA